MNELARLHPGDIALIAEAVIQRMRTDAPTTGRLLTARQVAKRLGVSADWVYLHQHDLGAVKLSDGPRARLRFDAETVTAALSARRDSRRSAPADHAPRRRSRRRTASGAPLLPIRAPNEGPKRDAEQV